jgi:hypothetical protein
MINTIATNNTDNPILRSVITGAVASAVAASTVNYRKVKNKEITTTQAVKETVKRSSQGAIATAAAVQSKLSNSKRWLFKSYDNTICRYGWYLCY